jgi:hypothetical protein
MTAAGRRRLALSMRRRWAKAKKAGSETFRVEDVDFEYVKTARHLHMSKPSNDPSSSYTYARNW